MKKSSPQQMETMVTFMEEHGDLNKPTTHARGKIGTLTKWEELSSLLNSDGTGDTKPTEKWKKVWSDLKNNTKKKAARLHRAASGTGGGPAVHCKLTELEQRVLNLIGLQVATGLALEEAGFSQDMPSGSRAIEVSDAPTCLNESILEENVELSQQPIIVITTEDNETVEGIEDIQPTNQPQVAVQPALSGHTPQGSPRRRVRGSPHGVTRGSPLGLRRGSPRRSRRRSPRVIRPVRSEEAAQQFLNCDREWRQFRIEQHRDYVEIKREQNRIRELELQNRQMELQTQREWQAVVLRGFDMLQNFLNRSE